MSEDFSLPSRRILECMRLFAVVAAALAFTSVASGDGGQVVRAHGVEATVPAGWERVASAGDGPVIDPRTLLVLGTVGVRAKPSQCQIAAYRIPPTGAVVVIVGWSSVAAAGGTPKPGRAPLQKLVAVRAHTAECFAGRAAASDVHLGGRLYQVNVMVGDSASSKRIAEALAVSRSFRLVP
jgi:hypothetical protein